MPSTSILSTFPKLGDCDIFQWKRNVCGYVKAVGLGVFLRSSVTPPLDSDLLDNFEMQQEQVMLVIRSTLDAVHAQHISSIDDPYLAITALETRHGVNSGLAAANIIIKIVTSRYDSSTKLEDYVSNMQSLHNQLAKTVSPTSNLKLSDQILALFVLINLPKDEFSSMIQQLLGDIENITTESFFKRLLTQAQMINTHDSETTVAFNVQQSKKPKPKITSKGSTERTSNAKDALCIYPGHQYSLHTNGNCIAQNSKPAGSKQAKPAETNRTSRPIGHNSLSDADKVRLFDKAAAKATSDSVTANAAVAMAAMTNEDSDEEVVNLTTAYSLMVKHPSTHPSDMYMDSGTNRDILNDQSRFTNLHPIRPVTIRSANGADDLVATRAGSVELPTYDEDDTLCHTVIHDALFCPDVAVNLISVTRLCDNGFTMSGDAHCMSFVHADGRKVFATRKANSMDLWSARVSTVTPVSLSSPAASNIIKTFNATADLMHQRFGHLHSAALRRFCSNHKLSKTCTSCILAKSHLKPFPSTLPHSSRVLFRVHSDVVGPLQSLTCSGKKYFVTFIDEASRFNRIFLISKKSEVFDCFRTYLASAERYTRQKLCVLKSDRGGEYRSARFMAFASAHGIILEQGPAKTPQHNGIAERFNRTVMERVRAQMIHSNMPLKLWGEAVMATSHVLNLSPSSSVDHSPHDTWHSCSTDNGAYRNDVDFLRVLGCEAFVHKHNDER